VVSTALHDYQGLSVAEAMASGCHALVPDRLAYPEIVPQEFRYVCGDDEEAELARHLIGMADDPVALRRKSAPDVSHLRWSRMKEAYRDVLARVAQR
jgi:glycosyltransferase involved in cell wall biosynthesis